MFILFEARYNDIEHHTFDTKEELESFIFCSTNKYLKECDKGAVLKENIMVFEATEEPKFMNIEYKPFLTEEEDGEEDEEEDDDSKNSFIF